MNKVIAWINGVEKEISAVGGGELIITNTTPKYEYHSETRFAEKKPLQAYTLENGLRIFVGLFKDIDSGCPLIALCDERGLMLDNSGIGVIQKDGLHLWGGVNPKYAQPERIEGTITVVGWGEGEEE